MTMENRAHRFTEVVGSPDWSQCLSPDVAAEVRREHFSIPCKPSPSLGAPRRSTGVTGSWWSSAQPRRDPAGEAARLCATCGGGQIHSANWERLTAGRRRRLECRALGPLTPRGLPPAVERVEVMWEPIVTDADTGTAGPSVPFLTGAAMGPPSLGATTER